MYFAEVPDVAERYMGKTVFNEPTLDKFTNGPNYYTDSSGKHFKVRDYVRNDKPVEVSSNEYNSKFKEVSDLYAKQNQGNLYKVDIPDKDIPNMLDWDKPFKEQPKEVQKALKSMADQYGSHLKSVIKDNDTGRVIYKHMGNYKRNVEKAGANPDVLVSQHLNEFGIKGIKYLDEGSRLNSYDVNYQGGQAFFKTLKEAKKFMATKPNSTLVEPPKGTSNFVVFDPKEVKILEKNNKSIEPTITVNNRNIPVTLHPVEERQGHKIEFVNTNKFENAFKKDETGYIGPLGTENAIKNRYKGVEEFLKTAPSMRASEAYVKPNGSVVFGDGRHRFAYLRDQGLDKIPISMDKESIKNAKKYGYID